MTCKRIGFYTFLFSNFMNAAIAFSQSVSTDVGIYAKFDKEKKEIVLKANYYYFCSPKNNAEQCTDDLIWTLSRPDEGPACPTISSGTFKGYHFVSGTLALENPVSVDPTTVPKQLCQYVKQVSKTIRIPVDSLKCKPALLYASGSLDSQSQLVINSSENPNTSFQKRCARLCKNGEALDSDNADLCLWCKRSQSGEALFPETRGPRVEDFCGSAVSESTEKF